MKKSSVALLIIFFFVAIDQIVKIWVKTTMSIGEASPVLGNWFYIYFVENEGMAFGLSFGAGIGKLLLSLVRIGVVGFLIYYLFALIKKKQADWTVVVILSLVIAGALGNIIDSMFYGIIWNYAPFLYGHVVDMFYFKLFMIPDWFPLWGGSYFFPAIFNVADSCVTLGIIAIIIWNKKFFISKKEENIPQP
ncbi:MAG: signal peptidase II [Bacteroidetes bacterium]|nr:signal peptidase II [Bacteroidota bacterium]MCL2303245.1 signal peptidase II [Lentimicrobiaceae bacterium]